MAIDGIGSIFSAPTNAAKAGEALEALFGGIKIVGKSEVVIEGNVALEGVIAAGLRTAGTLEAGAGIYNMSGGSGKSGIGSDGLTSEQRKEFNERLKNAKTQDEKNRIQYERNIVKRENEGKEPLDYDEWLERAERARENSNRGYANEKSGREALQKQYPDEKLINSNSKDNVVILTDETGTNFRPDSVCYNEDGTYKFIHDNKDLSGKKPYLYDTPQLRAERAAAKASGGEHIITVTSNKTLVNGNPVVKISAPASNDSKIFYVDKKSKVITHIWQEGKWIKV